MKRGLKLARPIIKPDEVVHVRTQAPMKRGLKPEAIVAVTFNRTSPNPGPDEEGIETCPVLASKADLPVSEPRPR